MNKENVDWLRNHSFKVITCDTEEKARDLLEYLHERGYKWASGKSLLDYTLWDEFEFNTCYSILKTKRVYVSSVLYYGGKHDSCKIINWEVL